jgi:hypothetical protein
VDVEVFFARLTALEIKTLFLVGHLQPRLVSACQIENGRCRDAVVYFSLARLHACALARLRTCLHACPPPRPFIRLGKARGPMSKSDFRVFPALPALHWLHLAITIRALRRGGGNVKAPGGCYIRQE